MLLFYARKLVNESSILRLRQHNYHIDSLPYEVDSALSETYKPEHSENLISMHICTHVWHAALEPIGAEPLNHSILRNNW